MDNSLEKLLQQVYELEGLVTLALKRGNNVPDMVLTMIGDKASAVNAAANSLNVVTANSDEPTDATAAAEPAPAAQPEGIDSLPDDEPDDDITVEIIEEPELNEEPATQPDDIESLPDDEPDDDITVEIIEEPEDSEEPVESEEQAPAEIAEEPVAEKPEEEAPASTPSHEAQDDNEDITLDEALQRNMTKDLRHAFSLNDRFRYRRELFGNSDSVMNETLNLVETMHSFDEAEDYFYNDLQWEHDSPEVADFMVNIKNHFWNKRQQV